MTRGSARTSPGRHPRQRGQIIVIFGGAMVLFMLLAACVIDLSWYWTNNLRMQRAADAAALAGVVFLPSDPTNAYVTARAEAAKNGYQHGVNGIVVTPVQDPSNDRRLKVAISGPINTYFARAIGIQSWPARRDSKADFVLPVPMGSPANYYGVFGLLRHPGGGVTTTETFPGNVTSWADPSSTPAGNWSNPSFAYQPQLSGTVDAATRNTITNPYQLWGNFGINLPGSGTVTVQGIEVDVRSRSNDPSGCTLRAALNWTGTTNVTSTSMTASQTVNLDDTYNYRTFGGSSDTWGRSWTLSDLSNGNFRVRLEYRDGSSSCTDGSTTSVDHIRVRVHYSLTTTVFTPDTNVAGPGGEVLNPQGFWGVMHGSGAEDINGDAYLPYYSQRTSSTNVEYDPVTFYNYAVEMPPGTTSGSVWVYDPVMCAVQSDMGTGDRWFGGSTTVWSFFDLYDTNGSLQNPGDDTLVASSGNLFKTQDALTDPSMGGPAVGSGRVDCTTSAGSTGGNAGGAYHNAWYRLPVNLTGGPNGSVYRLHTTTTDAGNASGNRDANGQNSFSLFVEAGGGSGSPRVYGLGAMEQYSPLPGGDNSEFYLAQIEDAHAGKTMEIRLWDIGDTPSGSLPVSLQILQPTSGGWTPATMSWKAQQGTTHSGVASCNSITGSGTTISATAGGTQYFQGCWLTITVPLALNYSAPQDGWWKIRYIVGGSSASSGFDLTTWEVSLRGNPVHLVLP